MPFDFPSSPGTGQEFVAGGVTYVYNGTGWAVKGGAANDFVAKVGDTMTGALQLPAANPTVATQAAHKSYVDGQISTAGALKADKTYVDSQDALKVAKAGDTMTGDLTISKATSPTLVLNKTTAATLAAIHGTNNGLLRWRIALGTPAAESGGNAGSEFAILSGDDAGAILTNPLLITRATSQIQTALPILPQTTWTDTAQAAARNSIGAAPFDALAYNGMQINGDIIVDQEATGNIQVVNGTKYFADGWIGACIGSLPSTLFSVDNAIPNPNFSKYARFFVITGKPTLAAGDLGKLMTPIEGYRIARLQWGTASAQPITIGFWVMTTGPAGTMTLAINNGANTRSYLTDVPITGGWAYHTRTIPGCVDGVWEKTNNTGMVISFCFGAGSTYIGTNNAWNNGNFNATAQTTNSFATTNNQGMINGVIVLPGPLAPTAAQSPLIMRPYDQELVTCQRYFQTIINSGGQSSIGAGHYYSVGQLNVPINFPVTMRVPPMVGTVSGADYFMSSRTGGTETFANFNATGSNPNGILIYSLGMGGTQGAGAWVIYNNPAARVHFDARL